MTAEQGRSRFSTRGLVGFGLSAVLLIVALVREDPGELIEHLRAAPMLVVVGGLALLLVRDLGADAARWWSLLRAAGHRVPYGSLARLVAATVPAKALLPFKAGDGVRVVVLHEQYGVPLTVGAATRFGNALLLLGALVGAGLLAGAGAGVGLLAGAAVGVALGGVALRWLGRPFVGFAVACAVFSVVLEVVVYAWVLAGFGVALTSEVLAGAVAVITAATVSGVLRGVGVREATLVGLAAATDRPPDIALAVGLTLSALEIATVLVSGAIGGALGGFSPERARDASPAPPAPDPAASTLDGPAAAPAPGPVAPPSGTAPR